MGDGQIADVHGGEAEIRNAGHFAGQMAEGYVGFAREHPTYFRLMFRPELSQPHNHPDTEDAGDAA
ncbi:TetR-like C-terminal domain-containing protein [Nocardia sp. NBC_01388]|uniref:TetR-like C-terminal domain-containing protein n=1 Tax=Nocardia sp. NBC_01388 TaxID=2903596 RepID=UPI003867E11C